MTEAWKPTSSEIDRLVESEQVAWGEKLIPRPPDGFFGVLANARRIQLRLAPHYFPAREYTEESPWPGKGIAPAGFFEMLKEGYLPATATRLPGAWALFDMTPKPTSRAFHTYPFEGLAMKEVLKHVRESGGIEIRPWAIPVCEDSRCGINHIELQNAVLPAIGKLLNVPDGGIVRSPSLLEWNIAANMFYPLFGDTSSFEWMDDTYGEYALIGGNYNYGGLANFRFQKRDEPHWYIGFRPMIVFPG